MPPHITILLIDNAPASINCLEVLQKEHGDVIKVVGHADSFLEGVRTIKEQVRWWSS